MATIKVFTYLSILVNILQSVVCAQLPCMPRPEIISLEKDGKYFYYGQVLSPSMHVELYRCSGDVASKSPEAYRCIPVQTQPIKLQLTQFGGRGAKTERTFDNHTSCAVECVCNVPGHENCSENVYTPKCEKGNWSRNQCRCEIPPEPIGCKTGSEGVAGGVSITMFAVALVIEFVIVLVVIFLIMDICKYRRHGQGILYKTQQYVRQLSTTGHDGFKITTLKREREATGSVSFLYEVNNGNATNGKPVRI